MQCAGAGLGARLGKFSESVVKINQMKDGGGCI